jgi:2-dehydropantoate 2-reductase
MSPRVHPELSIAGEIAELPYETIEAALWPLLRERFPGDPQLRIHCKMGELRCAATGFSLTIDGGLLTSSYHLGSLADALIFYRAISAALTQRGIWHNIEIMEREPDGAWGDAVTIAGELPFPAPRVPLTHVGVFGAGAVGGYLGVRLSSAGCPVVLVGRADLARERDALRAFDLRGAIAPPCPDLEVSEDPSALAKAFVCLVTVKSQDNAAIARTLARVLDRDALVICFQNGLDNAEQLRAAGLDREVIDGVVTFNVVREGSATFRQATSGPLVVGAASSRKSALRKLESAFEKAGLPLQVRENIAAVAAGKLLINLGNGLSAVTGLPIATTLASRPFRLCFSDCIREGLRVFEAAGRPVAPPDRVPLGVVAALARLPTPVFRAIARSLVHIDPEARSSTLQDLDRGRTTEIDRLNGAVVALAERHGVAAPLNRWVVEAVHRLEDAARPRPHLTPEELRAAFLALR